MDLNDKHGHKIVLKRLPDLNTEDVEGTRGSRQTFMYLKGTNLNGRRYDLTVMIQSGVAITE